MSAVEVQETPAAPKFCPLLSQTLSRMEPSELKFPNGKPRFHIRWQLVEVPCAKERCEWWDDGSCQAMPIVARKAQ